MGIYLYIYRIENGISNVSKANITTWGISFTFQCYEFFSKHSGCVSHLDARENNIFWAKYVSDSTNTSNEINLKYWPSLGNHMAMTEFLRIENRQLLYLSPSFRSISLRLCICKHSIDFIIFTVNQLNDERSLSVI